MAVPLVLPPILSASNSDGNFQFVPYGFAYRTMAASKSILYSFLQCFWSSIKQKINIPGKSNIALCDAKKSTHTHTHQTNTGTHAPNKWHKHSVLQCMRNCLIALCRSDGSAFFSSPSWNKQFCCCQSRTVYICYRLSLIYSSIAINLPWYFVWWHERRRGGGRANRWTRANA